VKMRGFIRLDTDSAECVGQGRSRCITRCCMRSSGCARVCFGSETGFKKDISKDPGSILLWHHVMDALYRTLGRRKVIHNHFFRFNFNCFLHKLTVPLPHRAVHFMNEETKPHSALYELFAAPLVRDRQHHK
jgi:hypothetical protein